LSQYFEEVEELVTRLLNVPGDNEVRLSHLRTAELLGPEVSFLSVEIATENLIIYKFPVTGQTPTEFSLE
jgi:hypothetical protein